MRGLYSALALGAFSTALLGGCATTSGQGPAVSAKQSEALPTPLLGARTVYVPPSAPDGNGGRFYVDARPVSTPAGSVVDAFIPSQKGFILLAPISGTQTAAQVRRGQFRGALLTPRNPLGVPLYGFYETSGAGTHARLLGVAACRTSARGVPMTAVTPNAVYCFAPGANHKARLYGFSSAGAPVAGPAGYDRLIPVKSGFLAIKKVSDPSGRSDLAVCSTPVAHLLVYRVIRQAGGWVAKKIGEFTQTRLQHLSLYAIPQRPIYVGMGSYSPTWAVDGVQFRLSTAASCSSNYLGGPSNTAGLMTGYVGMSDIGRFLQNVPGAQHGAYKSAVGYSTGAHAAEAFKGLIPAGALSDGTQAWAIYAHRSGHGWKSWASIVLPPTNTVGVFVYARSMSTGKTVTLFKPREPRRAAKSMLTIQSPSGAFVLPLDPQVEGGRAYDLKTGRWLGSAAVKAWLGAYQIALP